MHFKALVIGLTVEVKIQQYYVFIKKERVAYEAVKISSLSLILLTTFNHHFAILVRDHFIFITVRIIACKVLGPHHQTSM
jgi:hypothetical protein